MHFYMICLKCIFSQLGCGAKIRVPELAHRESCFLKDFHQSLVGAKKYKMQKCIGKCGYSHCLPHMQPGFYARKDGNWRQAQNSNYPANSSLSCLFDCHVSTCLYLKGTLMASALESNRIHGNP